MPGRVATAAWSVLPLLVAAAGLAVSPPVEPAAAAGVTHSDTQHDDKHDGKHDGKDHDKDKDKDDDGDDSGGAAADPGDDPDNNKSGDMVLLTTGLPSMVQGQRGWVGLLWTTETDVCEVRATARASSGAVSYPANTGSYSSLHINDALAEGNRDFLAFDVATPDSGPMSIEVSVSYTRLKDSDALRRTDDLVHQDVRGKDCKGNSGKQRLTLTVPLTTPSGPPVELGEQEVSIAAGEPTWVELPVTGHRPGLQDVRVRLEAPPELEVVYPGDGTSSGLARDRDLGVEATDVAGIRLRGDRPGVHRVPVRVSWTGGTWTGTLTVRVTG